MSQNVQQTRRLDKPDPWTDIGDNDALARRAAAGEAEALNVVITILELDGRFDWLDTELEVLQRYGIEGLGRFDLEDGPLVASLARAFDLRRELTIASAMQIFEGKSRTEQFAAAVTH